MVVLVRAQHAAPRLALASVVLSATNLLVSTGLSIFLPGAVSFANKFVLSPVPTRCSLFSYSPHGGSHASSRFPSVHFPRRRKRSARLARHRKAPCRNSRTAAQILRQRHRHFGPHRHPDLSPRDGYRHGRLRPSLPSDRARRRRFVAPVAKRLRQRPALFRYRRFLRQPSPRS